jgi:2-oxoglutarate ferredoxin oxidoreductase subunit gamma
MAMNQPSIERFAQSIQTGGILAYNAPLKPFNRSDLVVWPVPATIRAAELGSMQIANMVALGGLLPALEVISLPAVLQGLSRVIPAHRSTMLELNQKALEEGYASVSA